MSRVGAVRAWLGPAGGRRAQWRLRVVRRVIAGVLVAVALTGVARIARPPAQSTAPVVITTREVPAGSVLAAGDLTVVHRPVADLPEARLVDVASVAGRRVAGPLMTGEILTAARLVGSAPLPEGTRALFLPALSAGAAAPVRPGQRADIYRAGRATPLATDVLVLDVMLVTSSRSDGGGGPGLLVAADRATAGAIVAGQDVGAVDAGYTFAVH